MNMLRRRLFLFFLLLGMAGPLVWAQSSSGDRAVVLTVDGAIGPATTGYLQKNFDFAEEEEAALVIIRMDTPGGLSSAMRDIIQGIKASSVPVVVYVTPSGARAASAGTYILYASHLAAMTPATTLGAATPVQMGGGGGFPGSQDKPSEENGEEDEGKSGSPSQDAMTRKAVNDAAAFIRGLAQERGRNAEWAEKAVREAATLTASEALETNVIEIIATDMQDLLEQADGREIEIKGESITLETKDMSVERRDPDWRTRLLGLITNPTVAYLLLMMGIYGLIFEGLNPGALVPGVLGGIFLLVALFAFQILPVNYAGLLLIVLGVGLMVAEAFAPSFGILGIGGIISLIVGSIILMDIDVPGFAIPVGVIAGVATGTGGIFLVVIMMVMKAWKRPVVSGQTQLLGKNAEVLSDFSEEGWVHVQGERWRARTAAPLKEGQWAVITGIDGLTLHVKPKENQKESS